MINAFATIVARSYSRYALASRYVSLQSRERERQVNFGGTFVRWRWSSYSRRYGMPGGSSHKRSRKPGRMV